jgi:hypothetical protein
VMRRFVLWRRKPIRWGFAIRTVEIIANRWLTFGSQVRRTGGRDYRAVSIGVTRAIRAVLGRVWSGWDPEHSGRLHRGVMRPVAFTAPLHVTF